MANILDVATIGRTKTYIMHKCNLSHRQLHVYLKILQEKNLLKVEPHGEKSNPGKIFVTTDKGRAFLKAYDDLRATIETNNLKFRFKR